MSRGDTFRSDIEHGILPRVKGTALVYNTAVSLTGSYSVDGVPAPLIRLGIHIVQIAEKVPVYESVCLSRRKTTRKGGKGRYQEYRVDQLGT